MDNLASAVTSQALARSLGTTIMGSAIRFTPQTGSTNEDLKAAARDGAGEGLVLTTDEQTAGRGRRGRSWVAPPGSSLLLSILLRPTWLPPADAFYLTMLAAVACAEAIEQHVPVAVDLKWPNDLQIEGRKLGGILVETELAEQRLLWAVIGIGLNVNWDPRTVPELAQTATSLAAIAAIAAQPVARSSLLQSLLWRLDERYARLKHGERTRLYDDWRARLSTIGQRVRAEAHGTIREGIAETVTASGALILLDGAGVRHELTGGEVTVRARP